MADADTRPDRLCIDPRNLYYNAEVLARDVGIRFKGVEKTNVEEYCVGEGWIRVAAGKALDRYGQPLTIKLNGPVEAYYKTARTGLSAPDSSRFIKQSQHHKRTVKFFAGVRPPQSRHISRRYCPARNETRPA
jgi:Protein of unknown function (DUF3297)